MVPVTQRPVPGAADLVVACVALRSSPDAYLYTNPPTVVPPTAPAGRPNHLVLVPR